MPLAVDVAPVEPLICRAALSPLRDDAHFFCSFTVIVPLVFVNVHFVSTSTVKGEAFAPLSHESDCPYVPNVALNVSAAVTDVPTGT